MTSAEIATIEPAPILHAPAVAPTDLRRVWLLAFGHFTNDAYGNLATSMAPYFVLAGKMTPAVAGTVVLVYLAGSSVLQPIFGIVSDRTGRRWFAVAGPMWVGLMMSLMIAAPWAWAIFVCASLAGVGTAAFHPQGASMVNRVAGPARGWSMSIFSMGGNLGFGLGPVLAAVMASANSAWAIAMAVPGIICSSVLFKFAPVVKSQHMESTGKSLRDARQNAGALTIIVLIIAIRSGAMSAVIFLCPLYFHSQHLPANWGSIGSSIFLLMGAIAGLYAGRLSDRVGRTPIVMWSLVASAPLIFLVANVRGLVAWPVLAAAGVAILASNSVTVVQAQELLPANAGLAAGLTLGLGFGLSGVITFVASNVTQLAGPRDTLMLAAVLPLIAAGLAIFLRAPSPHVQTLR
jgi:FSR family fosmidomycin resistance protein-like MFS transporter